MLFVADVMLKKLARWLRIVGVPTIYAGDYTEDDDEILKLALSKKAVLLTQDKLLSRKARDYVPVVLLDTNDLEAQLTQIGGEYSLPLASFPSRTICPKCNGPLKRVGREKVKRKVFARILRLHDKFWLCSNCGTVYWEGSHWEKIANTVTRVYARLKRKRRG